jgi:hypothetical protein
MAHHRNHQMQKDTLISRMAELSSSTEQQEILNLRWAAYTREALDWSDREEELIAELEAREAKD